MKKFTYFEHTPAKQISLLFSVFDAFKIDRVRFADIIAALTVFDRPNDSGVEKFALIWKVYDTFGNDMSILDMALSVLTTCASNDLEVAAVEKEFKTVFRPCCYLSSITLDPKEEMELQQKAAVEKGERDERAKTASRSQRYSGAPPAYSICEAVLDCSMFKTILLKCPSTLLLIDNQLSARLVSCYGKDSRRIESNSLFSNIPSEDK